MTLTKPERIIGPEPNPTKITPKMENLVMAGRDRIIAVQAIAKSLIEAGMTTPDEEFELTLKQHLAIVERVAGVSLENTPVPEPVACLSEIGGGKSVGMNTNSDSPFKILAIEDRGKYQRVQVERDGRKAWCSAWDSDGDVCRQAGVGGTVRAQVVTKGNYTNLKKTQLISSGGDNIPF